MHREDGLRCVGDVLGEVALACLLLPRRKGLGDLHPQLDGR